MKTKNLSHLTKTLEVALDALIPYMKQFAEDEAGKQDLLRKIAKAATIKSYEYLITINGANDSDFFFLLPALRGICEDYITIRFLAKHMNKDADQAVLYRIQEELYNSVKTQWAFFEKNHPSQKLFYDPLSTDKAKTYRDKLREIIHKNGFQSANLYSALPKIKEMAKKSDLLELYEYVYHATSSLVHFSPRILIRMGWGSLPGITFSALTNFGDYYKAFAVFYGSYLYVELIKFLVSSKLLGNEILPHIESIERALHSEERWPELVTFEEMNIGSITRILFHKSPEEVNGTRVINSIVPAVPALAHLEVAKPEAANAELTNATSASSPEAIPLARPVPADDNGGN